MLSTRRLVLWEDTIGWDGTTLKLDRIDGMAYEIVRNRTDVVPTYTAYTAWLRHGEEVLEIAITSSVFARPSRRREIADFFEAFIGLMNERVGAPLVERMLGGVERGAVERIGPINVGKDGLVLRRGGRSATWAELEGAELRSGSVTIHRSATGAGRRFARLPMKAYNAVLLDLLIQTAKERGRLGPY